MTLLQESYLVATISAALAEAWCGCGRCHYALAHQLGRRLVLRRTTWGRA